MVRKLRTKKGKRSIADGDSGSSRYLASTLPAGSTAFSRVAYAEPTRSLFPATYNLQKLWRSGWPPDSGNTGGGAASTPG